MKIIVLQGRANCGKTSVVTKLYLKLRAKCTQVAYKQANNCGDFCSVFNIDNHIVGITSVGDSYADLIQAFTFFENDNCELCLVCCRKKDGKDGSKKAVKEKEKQYGTKIVWYNKAYLDFYNEKYNCGLEIDEINDIQAKVLMEEILLQI